MAPTALPHDSGWRLDADDHEVVGRTQLRRVGRRGFPVFELVHDETVLARLGRLGWLRIYLGRGCRVELADGTRWHIRAATIGGFVCPLVVDGAGRKVALARGGTGIYGLSGRDYGYTLNPGPKRRRANTRWILRHHEEDIAVVTRRPPTLDAATSVHLGAVLLSMVLIKYGVPDDSRIGMPTIRWG
jgi:hypothetical protein